MSGRYKPSQVSPSDEEVADDDDDDTDEDEDPLSAAGVEATAKGDDPSSKPRRRRSTLREEVVVVQQRLKNSNRHVIDPQGKEIYYWDLMSILSLVCIVLVVPFEVAFVEWTTEVDRLFVMNRVLDLYLACDVVLQFFLAYHDESRGNILIKNRRLIRKRYLASMFLPDLISSIPFGLMFYALHRILDDGKCIQPQRLAAVRLLRLLRLFRVQRCVQIYRRYEVYAAFTMSYTSFGVMRLVCALGVFAHWLGCIWGLAANPELVGRNEWTWVTKRASDLRVKLKGDADDPEEDDDSISTSSYREHFDPNSAIQTYVTSLYFSIYTMTGIGYGDIHATNFRETAVCVVLMASGAVFWCFAIGSISHLIRSVDLAETRYREQMDALNAMMHDRKFPRDLRKRCRWFLIMSKQHQKRADHSRLESLFSASLRNDVVFVMNEAWLNQVFYLRDASRDFIVLLAERMRSVMYAPMEAIEVAFSLVILQNGIVAKAGRIYSKGAVWGQEFLMKEMDLIDYTIAAALSYALVSTLHRDDVYDILGCGFFEAEQAEIDKASKFYSLKMRLLKLARAETRQRSALTLVATRRQSSKAPDSARSQPDSLRGSARGVGVDPRLPGGDDGAGHARHTQLAPLSSLEAGASTMPRAPPALERAPSRSGLNGAYETARIVETLDVLGNSILMLDAKIDGLRKELRGSTLEMSGSLRSSNGSQRWKARKNSYPAPKRVDT